MGMRTAIAVILLFAAPARADVLVELYTSQGCSSCPPADKLLSRLGREPGVVALAFHVDYWDHIGWADPFSKATWTERQHGYARALRSRSVYTPQLVVAGTAHAVGSDERAVRRLLEEARKRPVAARLSGRLEPNARGLQVAVDATSTGGRELRVFAAVVEEGLVTRVQRGENSGRTLANDHVVRRLEEVMTVGAGARAQRTVTIALAPDWKRERLAVVLFAQDPKTLRVEAATRVK
jgi:hypothetical protein